MAAFLAQYWGGRKTYSAHRDHPMTTGIPMTNHPTPGRATPPPRRRRHLMDPNNPRPPQTRRDMSLSQVQRWVLSTVTVTTILHMSAGLLLAAFAVDTLDARIGLLVIAGLFGVLSVAAGLAIHQRRILSWWLLLGCAPTLLGAYLLFWA